MILETITPAQAITGKLLKNALTRNEIVRREIHKTFN